MNSFDVSAMSDDPDRQLHRRESGIADISMRRFAARGRRSISSTGSVLVTF